MKTLDEVIDALEVCTSGYCSHPKHGDCPYLDERNDCDTRQRKLDALHYLKEYRAGQKAVDAAIARYDEAVKNCERAENIYKQKQKAAEDALWICKEDKDDLTALRAYWAEQHETNALSWDELRTMEGKPVWVERCNGDTKGWLLILSTNYDVINCTTKHGNSFYLYKNHYCEKWQAYRKERNVD